MSQLITTSTTTRSRRSLERHFLRAAHCRRIWFCQTWRSEEHTSELQSQSNLVCRLLLEKKTSDAQQLARPSVDSISLRPLDRRARAHPDCEAAPVCHLGARTLHPGRAAVYPLAPPPRPA